MDKKGIDHEKEGTRKPIMRRLTMLVVLVAALVVASSTTGALLAQNTHKHSTQQGTTQQGTTPNTQQPANAASGASPQAVNNCGIQQGGLTGYKIYGPYTYDPVYRDSTDVGANNHSLVYGFFVPQPPQNNNTYADFYVCKYDLNTGTETFTGVDLATYSDFGYGLSYLDPPPSGSSYAIHDALLPPLGPIDGTGYYAIYERLYIGGQYLYSNPHYFHVH